jgi:transcriptional regulator with XRE-family HTH domain
MVEVIEYGSKMLPRHRVELGNAILQLRMSRKLTQVECAKKLGWTRTTLLAIEKAQQATTVDQLYELAEVLKVDVTAFFPLNLNAWLQNARKIDLGNSVADRIQTRENKR